MASCLFNFPIPLNLVYILYGIGIGPIFPTILGYLKLSNVATIHFIFISKALANLLSPIVINEIINKYGKKIYSSFAFLSSLAYILFFVGILNYHASKSYDDLTDGKYKIWYLFFGNKTDTAKRKVRKVMRSFRNKSFKAITTVRHHARTWSSKRVKNISQGRGKKLNRYNERKKTLEVPSSKSIEECNISNSYDNKEELISNNNLTFTEPQIHVQI
uniref:MFS domain-containing protein n=1 Tax=Strongyloides papillosus TaxID=174720 RepID=A0A0N5BK37_STREA